MKPITAARLAIVGLLLLALLVASYGYVANDDSLFQFGVYAEFVLILVSAALHTWDARDESEPDPNSQ